MSAPDLLAKLETNPKLVRIDELMFVEITNQPILSHFPSSNLLTFLLISYYVPQYDVDYIASKRLFAKTNVHHTLSFSFFFVHATKSLKEASTNNSSLYSFHAFTLYARIRSTPASLPI